MTTIHDLTPGDLAAAATVAGQGLRDNPMTVRTLGGGPESRGRAMTRMFLPLLRRCHAKGAVLGAFDGGRLVGVCGMVPPGACRLTTAQRLPLLPAVLQGVPPHRLPGFLRWVRTWERLDPDEHHWHLGPVAVRQDLRGLGIGRALLAEFCRRMDLVGGNAYLETDRIENTRFYERFAFAVHETSQVLGVPNWFMVRPHRR